MSYPKKISINLPKILSVSIGNGNDNVVLDTQDGWAEAASQLISAVCHASGQPELAVRFFNMLCHAEPDYKVVPVKGYPSASVKDLVKWALAVADSEKVSMNDVTRDCLRIAATNVKGDYES